MSEEKQLGDAVASATRFSEKSDVSVEDTWKCTQHQVSQFSHTWTIRDFGFYTLDFGTYSSVKSPTFLTSVNGNTSKWFLELYPSGNEFVNNGYSTPGYTTGNVSLYLCLVHSDQEPVRAEFSLSLLNPKLGKTMYTLTHSRCQFQTHQPRQNLKNGFSIFIKRKLLFDETKDFLSNDTLTIKCEIITTEEIVSISTHLHEEQSVHKLKLSSQLKTLFDRKEMTDVTLIAGEQEFAAHKAILAARSPVFAAMFERVQNNKVTITDVDPEMLEEILVFIYTDESPNLENNAADLLVVADKYDLGRLKRMCEEVLCVTITTDNVAEILSFAHSHNAETLEAKATDFLDFHSTSLMKTQAWKDMLSKNLNLLSEAFKQVSK